MSKRGVGLTDAQSQREAIVQPGMGEIEIAAAVEAVHQTLIRLVPALVSKTHQIQRDGRGQFETVVILYPLGKVLRQFNMLPDVMLQSFDPVMADHKPQFE